MQNLFVSESCDIYVRFLYVSISENHSKIYKLGKTSKWNQIKIKQMF